MDIVFSKYVYICKFMINLIVMMKRFKIFIVRLIFKLILLVELRIILIKVYI